MKSADRIIKDIRFYETKPKDYVGNFNGILGNIYQVTEDTNSICQRIARKLNEVEFVCGDFDHIYIHLSEKIEIGKVIENEKTLDKQIKNFDYGIEPKKFNSLKEFEKDLLIKEVTFKTLKQICKNNSERLQKITEVENLINEFKTEIEIAYKIKENNSCKIEISYMIEPNKKLSKVVVRYLNKKENTRKIATKDLYFYEDIFYLIDKISIKDDKIIFNSKKSSIGELAISKYEKPTEIEINEMEKI